MLVGVAGQRLGAPRGGDPLARRLPGQVESHLIDHLFRVTIRRQVDAVAEQLLLAVVAQLVGLVVGYPIGATAGVWLAGRLLGRSGSAWATLLGAGLGVALALLLTPLVAGGAALLGWALLFTVGMLGALAGYHRFHRRLLRR